MPVTILPSDQLTTEQKELITELYEKKKLSIARVSVAVDVRPKIVQGYLMQIGIYRHRFNSIEQFFPEPEGCRWSKFEDQYGKTGSNMKYLLDELSKSEKALFEDRYHRDLKQF